MVFEDAENINVVLFANNLTLRDCCYIYVGLALRLELGMRA